MAELKKSNSVSVLDTLEDTVPVTDTVLRTTDPNIAFRLGVPLPRPSLGKPKSVEQQTKDIIGIASEQNISLDEAEQIYPTIMAKESSVWDKPLGFLHRIYDFLGPFPIPEAPKIRYTANQIKDYFKYGLYKKDVPTALKKLPKDVAGGFISMGKMPLQLTRLATEISPEPLDIVGPQRALGLGGAVPPVTKVEMTERAKKVNAKIDDFVNEHFPLDETIDWNMTPLAKLTQITARGGLPSMTVAIGASIMTGNPWPGLIILGSIETGGAYERQRGYGETPGKAALKALASGGIEIATEKIPFDFLLHGNILLGAPLESLQEKLAGLGQNYIDEYSRLTIEEGLEPGEASRQAVKFARKQSDEDALVGATLGLLGSGAVATGRAVTGEKAERLPTKEEAQAKILEDYISKLETAVEKGDIRKAKETIEAKPPPTEAIPAPEKPVAGRKPEIAPTAKPEAVEVAPEKLTIRKIPISEGERTDFVTKGQKNYWDIFNEKGEWVERLNTKKEAEAYIKERQAQPLTVAKPKPKPPKIPPLSKETKDILGGVEPISQIHKALSAAKAVRPITEAAKKEALRKKVGAAAGALRENLRKGMPAEQAIQLSTGLLKGPLTEYTQLYESIEDILDPEVKNTARLMITEHPDLKYFEVVNTNKSFTKLIQGSSLTPNEAAQIERVFGKAFEEQLAKVTTKSDLYERLIATWKAGLLTGMKTSGLNILSTASHAVSETAKDVPAALIDSGVALVTGERTVAFTAKGYGFGFKEGLGKGWRYMKTGYDERNVLEKYDYKRTSFGTSKPAKAQQAYVEFIFHLLGAEDQPFYYGALSRSLYSQAIAQAKNKGLKGKERQAFVDNLQKNPTDEMLEWAKEDAETAIYTNRTHLGDVAKSIQKVKGGEIVVPFGRTPSAVAMQIVNYSPVGVVKEIAHEIHEGRFNQRKFSQAAGRTVVGTSAMYLGAQLFKAGLIALGYPDNERERKLWELEGRKPNSIKIKDEWRDVQAFGPLGNLLVIGGYFQQALDSKGSPTEAMIEAMAGGAKSFTEQTFVRGVNLAVDALTDPEASFERWFTSMSGSLVPTIVADIARAQDDRARRAVGPKERIQSRIPIYRKGLPPKIDVFGQDLPRYGGNVFETMIDPTRPSKIRQDVVVDELRRLWDKDIKVSPTLLGDKAGYDILTKEENTQLWQRAGELTYKALFGVVNTDNYEKSNDFVKGQLVEFITSQAKAAAKAEIVNIKLKQGKTILKLAESGLLSIDSLEALKYFQESVIETKEEKVKGTLR